MASAAGLDPILFTVPGGGVMARRAVGSRIHLHLDLASSPILPA